jgi:ArsR family transcriptional regulator
MAMPVAQDILKKCEEVSQLLKILAHPDRLRILCRLLDGKATVGEITEFCDISQSATSQFLARMKTEGLLSSEREGSYVYYSIADRRLVQLLRSIRDSYCTK